jgi:hypothetical protein
MGNANNSGISVYGFVVFSVLIVIGIMMMNSIVTSSNNSSAPSPLANTVNLVVNGVNGGMSIVVIGIGILGAVVVLKGLNYL